LEIYIPKETINIFNQITESMMTGIVGSNNIADCMSLQPAKIKNAPLRFRIISLGFVQKLDLEQLNEKLVSNNCSKLYPRNFWESTLIYAFQNKLSYGEWLELSKECEFIYEELSSQNTFTSNKIIFEELENYVKNNSDESAAFYATRAITRRTNDELDKVSDRQALIAFLTDNIAAFSGVREKTRYYFCKYLLYYLNRRIDNYFEACFKDQGVENALQELLALKVVTTLRRSKKNMLI